MLTQDRLKELLDYDPKTGEFTWKTAKARNIKVGSKAGAMNNYGSITIVIDKERHSAAKLAFLWMTGEYPETRIHHKNKAPEDNRFSNLLLTKKRIVGTRTPPPWENNPNWELNGQTIHDILQYDAVLGHFLWRVSAARNIKPGSLAGCPGTQNSWQIRIKGKLYQKPRLLWLYTFGEWPNAGRFCGRRKMNESYRLMLEKLSVDSRG